MLPHSRVHGRRQDHLSREGQVQRREKIVGQSAGELRQQIGRRRRNYEHFIFLGNGDVLDRARSSFLIARLREQAGDHFAAGQRGKCERLNELLRAPAS